jgi:hypothetical protein
MAQQIAPCPFCRYETVCAEPAERNAMVWPGDLMMCARCAQFSEFTVREVGPLKRLTLEEIEPNAAPAEIYRCKAYQRAVRAKFREDAGGMPGRLSLGRAVAAIRRHRRRLAPSIKCQ